MSTQTSYSLTCALGVAGQIASGEDTFVTSYPASEDIPAGVLVELDTSTGKIRRPQQVNGGLGPVVGVSVYKNYKEPAASGALYVSGEMVPVLRKGKIFAQWSGTTQTALTAPNVHHSSTTATNRGKFTDAAAANTAGSEIAAAPEGILMVKATSVSTLCLVELNLPA